MLNIIKFYTEQIPLHDIKEKMCKMRYDQHQLFLIISQILTQK